MVRGRRVRKREWPADQWIKVTYVGTDFVCAKTWEAEEVIFPYDERDHDWHLFNPHIPLKPLKIDYEDSL